MKYVNGDDIKAWLHDVDVCITRRLPGELEGLKFDIFCLKEPDYVIIRMLSYGSLKSKLNQKKSVQIVNGAMKTFKYNNMVAGIHFDYNDDVEHKSILLHTLLEHLQTCATHWSCGILKGSSTSGWIITR